MEGRDEKNDDLMSSLESDIEKTFKPLFKQMEELTKHMKMVYGQLEMRQLKFPKIELPDFSLISNLFKCITSSGFMKELARMSEPEYERFMQEFGWMGPLSLPAFFACYDRYKEDENVEVAWNALIDFFRIPEMLHEVEESFEQSEILRKRIAVLSKGLEHHKNRDYISSVSVLLPQVEGLIWDIGVAKGIVDPSYNSEVRMENGEPDLGKNNAPVRWRLAELVETIWGFSHRSHKAFSTKYGRELYSRDFRHPILHGRDISKFNEKDSVIVIMCLMCVGEMASRYEP